MNDPAEVDTPLTLFLKKVKDPKPDGDGYLAICPVHKDGRESNPSLVISEGADGRVLVKCRAGCETEAIVKKLGLKMRDLFARAALSLEEYAEAKGLPVAFLKGLGISTFGDGKESKKGPWVRIPYRDSNGDERAVRFRHALEKAGDGADRRFSWKTGSKVMPYGLDRLGDARKRGHVVIVEGESDAQTLWLHEIPALGIPGAGTWNDEKWAGHLDHIDDVYLCVEPDSGGQNLLKSFERSKVLERLRLIRFDDGAKDPSALYLGDRKRFPTRFADLMEKALTWDENVAELAAAARREAAGACKDVIASETILDDFMVELDKAGVVGEARAAKLLYLAVTSRVQSRIVSLAFKASSSSGKSYLMQKVLEFFPDEAYYSLSLMSEKLLARFDEPMKNRFLVIYEAAGISRSENSQQQYMVRSLLSEGRIKYGVVVKGDDGGMHADVLELEGPTGFLTTTTSVFLEPELETRILSVPLTETREQTEAVMRRTAEQRPDASDKARWRAFQTWLANGPVEVHVPYAESLAKLIPGVTQRLRRDFSTIMELVKAHALLHQESRKRDKLKRIVADRSDYAAVHALVNDLIAESVGLQVSERARAVVGAIKEMMTERPGATAASTSAAGVSRTVVDGGFPGATNTEIARKLRTTKQGIATWIRDAEAGGWIKNESEKRGQHRWKLDNEMFAAEAVLPHPDALESATKRRELERAAELADQAAAGSKAVNAVKPSGDPIAFSAPPGSAERGKAVGPAGRVTPLTALPSPVPPDDVEGDIEGQIQKVRERLAAASGSKASDPDVTSITDASADPAAKSVEVRILTLLGDRQPHFETELFVDSARGVPPERLTHRAVELRKLTRPLRADELEAAIRQGARSYAGDALRSLRGRGLIRPVKRDGQPAWQLATQPSEKRTGKSTVKKRRAA